jgi:hypothetical protein
MVDILKYLWVIISLFIVVLTSLVSSIAIGNQFMLKKI